MYPSHPQINVRNEEIKLIIKTILLTSAVPPIDGARGSITSPGTNKTGKNFANKAAPGVRDWKMVVDNDGLMNSVPSKKINNPIQPANAGGNLIPVNRNPSLVIFSITPITTVPKIAIGNVLGTDDEPPRIVVVVFVGVNESI